jgi:hypothetical protein
MNLDTAKAVAVETLQQAQILLRKNKFLEPIFLALTDEDTNQDWPEDDYSGEARAEAVAEGYAELIKKHLDTTEAMVMIFQSVAVEVIGKKPVDMTKVNAEDYHECIVCVVHTKEKTEVMQSIYATENGDCVFIDCAWDVVEKGFNSIFSNPYLASSGNI